MPHKITLPKLTYSKNKNSSVRLWILLTTSNEDVTFTPGRTSKDTTLHHSLQEQIITIIGGGREKLCVSSVAIIYEQMNYWSMLRADVGNN